jgi:hypothetical protein
MKLHDYILSKLNEPFKFGVNDCVLFTIGWVEIDTGKKYLPTKIWKDEKEALRLMKKNGGLIAVFDNNFKRIEPNFAKDGCLTVIDGIAFLFSGSKVVSVSDKGLVYRSRLLAKEAWSYE